MRPGQKLWTKEELVLAINLYSKLEFGKMHSRNPKVIELAKLIGRTSGSVAFKLVNFASLDPELKKRGIKGADHSSELDRETWLEFHKNWDAAFENSEQILASKKHQTVLDMYDVDLSGITEKGLEKTRLIKVRVNQYRFRQMVLANYKNTCCITGLKQSQLLIASHITLWSKYENNRLNPANGLCLNALHDMAFEKGLLTVSADDYRICISSILKSQSTKEVKKYFLQYDGKKILIPKKFPPEQEFLRIHNDHFKP